MSELYTGVGPGNTTRTDPQIQYFDVAANAQVVQGSVVSNEGGTGFTNSTATSTLPKYVAIEAVDNDGGTEGALKIGVVGAGQFVTVKAGGAIQVGAYVKVGTAGDSDDVTEVEQLGATDSADLIVGRYFSRPSGNVTRGTASPFNEEYQDEGDYNVDDAADGDIIEIRVGNA